MTAKTGKHEADELDEVDEAAAGPAEAESEETSGAAARPARPARRKRRVRVIEVIDDEDLDEVLEALDAEDALEDEEEDERPARRPAKPAKPAARPAAKPAAKAAPKPAKAKPRPARLDPPEEVDEEVEEVEEVEETGDEAPDEAAPKKKRPIPRAAAASTGAGAPRTGPFSPVVLQATVIVLIALLVSFGIWQRQSASNLASAEDEREAVGKVAKEYGNVAFNYDAQNYRTQVDRAQKLMAGDLLEEYKSNTLPNLGEGFEKNPEAGMSSKTEEVFVGSVNGRFATAVVMVEIGLKTKESSSTAPATLLRLNLAKIDGEWKVTRQYASGVNEQNRNRNALPGAPTGEASASPSPDKSEKPGD